jgi:hypothetical protein
VTNDEARQPTPDTSTEVDPDVAELLGLRPTDAPDLPGEDEVDERGEPTDTAVYEGEPPGDGEAAEDGGDLQLEPLAPGELRGGETDNPDEAAEEGLTWVPPTDPPIVAGSFDEAGDPVIASGFGSTAEDEPFDEDHHGELLFDTDERSARVEEALRADARTSGFEERIAVRSVGDRVILEGAVEDLVDEESAIAVAEEVDGVTEVVSRIEVAALEGRPSE